MNRLDIWIVGIFLIFICHEVSTASGVLKIGVSVLPPWKIERNGAVEGPEPEILTKIAEKLDLETEFFILPFKRCLRYMKDGNVDIMTGLLKKQEREEYILYIAPPYKKKSNKSFYVLKGKKESITSFEDLYGLKIGKKIGAKFFQAFDEDKRLDVDEIAIPEKNILKLLRQRIDTFIMTDSEADYYLHTMGVQDQIEKASFGYYKENPVYIGISRKSFLMNRKEELSGIVSSMIRSGEMDRIITSFFKRNSIPIPDYK